MALSRGSGILLHLSSLPSPHGIGDLGPQAHRFLEFLQAAGQRYWQVLPLGPTGEGDSPYQSFSAFAGNPLLISLDELRDQGLLLAKDLKGADFPTDHVAYEDVQPWKMERLRRAFGRFEATHPEVLEFEALASSWLEDYALFMALKAHHGGSGWDEWEPGARFRDPKAIARYREVLDEEIRFQRFLQYQFFRQFTTLKRQAMEKGIALVGDMPIFVAYDSADVWSYPELFLLDGDRRPLAVAGVPPDYFSTDGQVWGNPLYQWDNLARTGFSWWVERMQMALALFDWVRIDHFRGFVSCWAIPPRDKTAVRGRWLEAPGHALLETLFARLGRLPLIAEDLGIITPEVVHLRDRFGIPGMKVLQFAFGGGEDNPYLPHRHPPHSVVYTGTHDNDTTVGWFRQAPLAEKHAVLGYTGTDGRRIALDLIRLALQSAANLAIIPMQDLLELDSGSRMNTPGTKQGNWTWRLVPDAASTELADGIRAFTRSFGR